MMDIYVVIPAGGVSCLDDDDEIGPFDTFEIAESHAKDLAAKMPGIPIDIYGRIAEVEATAGNVQTRRIAELTTPPLPQQHSSGQAEPRAHDEQA